MQSILSCFACGEKNESSVVTHLSNAGRPRERAGQSDQSVEIERKRNVPHIAIPRKTDDNKSRVSMTTVTFLTSETAPSKSEDDD